MSLDLSRPPTYLDKLPKDLVGYLVDVMSSYTPKYTLIAEMCEPLMDNLEHFTQISQEHPPNQYLKERLQGCKHHSHTLQISPQSSHESEINIIIGMDVMIGSNGMIEISYNEYQELEREVEHADPFNGYSYIYGSSNVITTEEYTTLINNIKTGKYFKLGQFELDNKHAIFGLDMSLHITPDMNEMITAFRKQLGKCLEELKHYEEMLTILST
jgi:hypothetical protein